MSAWQLLIWAATCGAGVLAFLKAVADEISRVKANLGRLEQTERKALQLRRHMTGREINGSSAAAA